MLLYKNIYLNWNLCLEGGIDLTKKNYRVFFESSDVDYDGIPYVYVADKMYICHLGKDKTEVTRQKIRQQSMERRMKVNILELINGVTYSLYILRNASWHFFWIYHPVVCILFSRKLLNSGCS